MHVLCQLSTWPCMCCSRATPWPDSGDAMPECRLWPPQKLTLSGCAQRRARCAPPGTSLAVPRTGDALPGLTWLYIYLQASTSPLQDPGRRVSPSRSSAGGSEALHAGPACMLLPLKPLSLNLVQVSPLSRCHSNRSPLAPGPGRPLLNNAFVPARLRGRGPDRQPGDGPASCQRHGPGWWHPGVPLGR